MSANLIAVAQPAVAKRRAVFSRICLAVWEAAAGYVARRSAIATLRELDDHALRDIGIARSQIEAAVQGLIPLPDQARMS
jgi:uncharacterized protein YjiS (DUF1127 family)